MIGSGAGFARRQLFLAQLQRADELVYFWEGTKVFVGDASGAAWRQLSIRGFRVDVSPNGRHLCYMQQEGTNTFLCTSRLDGTRERRLTRTQSQGRWIDDDTILYHHEDLWSVWAIDVRTGARRKCFDWSVITPNGFSGHLELSPDRTRLLSNPQNGAFSPTQDLFICDLDGGKVRSVWEDPANDVEDSNALWLSGDRFVWRRGRQPGHDQRGMAIVTCRLGETNLQALTDWEGLTWPLAASPDGGRVLYLQELRPRGGAMELWMMNVDGSDPHPFLARPLALPTEGDLGMYWYGRKKAGR
jgi:Tol biopolymer transport system component